MIKLHKWYSLYQTEVVEYLYKFCPYEELGYIKNRQVMQAVRITC